MDLSLTVEETAFQDQVRSWLEANFEMPPAFRSLEEEFDWGRRWQARLAADRWVGIHWPEAYGGRGATPFQVAIFNMEYARSKASQPVNRNGINHVGPTLLAHGNEEQKARWLPRILDAREIWCQLFSEPGAGSDLASLTTRAIDAGDGWVLQGQKVWTSYAQFARWGIALVRTDADAPKHKGLSYLVVDMTAPGIEIRPLVTITGESEFNEVFLDEVFVPTDCLVGGLNQGWSVANTTLAHERGATFPFKEQVVHEVYLEELYALAAELGTLDDPLVAEALAEAAVRLRILRLHNWRTLSRLTKGVEPGPESSVIKLSWADMTQTLSDAALLVTGDASPLWGPAGGNPMAGKWQQQWLWSRAATIAGGTSEIQRTIIGDRILGLPR
ncbi:MAG TPA: acyl-CoA dehydrogenase family protein [Acidimicrobiales bacterium]